MFNDKIDDMPIYGTISSQFNDAGLNKMYFHLLQTFKNKIKYFNKITPKLIDSTKSSELISQKRNRYLSEISDVISDVFGSQKVLVWH